MPESQREGVAFYTEAGMHARPISPNAEYRPKWGMGETRDGKEKQDVLTVFEHLGVR